VQTREKISTKFIQGIDLRRKKKLRSMKRRSSMTIARKPHGIRQRRSNLFHSESKKGKGEKEKGRQ
jgi:hypothetical protein